MCQKAQPLCGQSVIWMPSSTTCVIWYLPVSSPAPFGEMDEGLPQEYPGQQFPDPMSAKAGFPVEYGI